MIFQKRQKALLWSKGFNYGTMFSLQEKVVLGVILMTITIGPGCWFLSETSKIRAIAREAEQDDD